MQSNSDSNIKVLYPPVIGADELSILLKRKNINQDRCSRPYTLPQACLIPGTQKPLWVVEDVLAWLRQFKEQPSRPEQVVKKIGAPTKAERVAKRRAAEAINNSNLSTMIALLLVATRS